MSRDFFFSLLITLLFFLTQHCHHITADTTCSAVDPAINTIGKCHNNSNGGLSLGIWGYSLFSFNNHNYLVNAQKTTDEFWNVDDPFNPILDRSVSGLNQCRGPVYTNPRKMGNYLIHFGSSSSSCNCEEGKPCIPYVNASISGVVSTMKLCDNSVYPVNTKDVSAVAKLANPLIACAPLTTNLNGNIAVIQRGICSFQEKLNNAIAAGAIAVIIINSNFTSGCIPPGIESSTIPIVMITIKDGLPIITALFKGIPVTISLGPSFFFPFVSSQQNAPFGGVWGTSQNVQVAPLGVTSASQYQQFSDSSLPNLYNPVGVIGLNKRPDAETTNYFIVKDNTRAAIASVVGGNFSLVTKAFTLPVSNLEDIGGAVFFVKNSRYWLASSNFEHDQLVLYSITNVVAGQTPNITKFSSVNLFGNQAALPIPPDNNYIYANTGEEEPNCTFAYRRYEIYNFTNMSSPQFIRHYQTIIKSGGGTDQLNDGDFLLANDGTLVGAICATSEGVMLFNANDPANPITLGSFDSSLAEGSFENGAVNCAAGTDGATWWFQQNEDNSICAVQVRSGVGSAGSMASGSSSFCSFLFGGSVVVWLWLWLVVWFWG